MSKSSYQSWPISLFELMESTAVKYSTKYVFRHELSFMIHRDDTCELISVKEWLRRHDSVMLILSQVALVTEV